MKTHSSGIRDAEFVLHRQKLTTSLFLFASPLSQEKKKIHYVMEAIFNELIFMALSTQRRKHMDDIANLVPCMLQALCAVF